MVLIGTNSPIFTFVSNLLVILTKLESQTQDHTLQGEGIDTQSNPSQCPSVIKYAFKCVREIYQISFVAASRMI